MFGLFKKKKYRQDILPKISGEDHGIEITFKNFPIRVSEEQPEKRIPYCSNFNPELIQAIWKEIESFDYDDFVALALTKPVALNVKVMTAPAFVCEISLKQKTSKRQFIGEWPDAIIKAFKSEKISP